MIYYIYTVWGSQALSEPERRHTDKIHFGFSLHVNDAVSFHLIEWERDGVCVYVLEASSLF